MRFHIALWGGKLSLRLLRLLGRDATYFPGHVALRLCPEFLGRVGRPATVIGVTGTNGKTTCTNLLADLLEAMGKDVLSNRKGSNIDAGVATALLEDCSLGGKARRDLAVLEIDERSARKIYPHLQPDILLCTNLFRDSMRRNAHPEYIADLLGRAIPKGTRLVLNADDLLSCRMAPENARVCFSMDAMPGEKTTDNIVRDISVCPVCGRPLQWELRRYHHIGQAFCDCGFRSPEAKYRTTAAADGRMTVLEDGTETQYPLINDAVFNMYNQLSAIAVLRELGETPETIAAALEGAGIVASRFQEDTVGGVTVTMLTAKGLNAVACSRAFDYVGKAPGRKAVALMFDDIFDEKETSENVAWIYDADYEFLAHGDLQQVVACGPRAADAKLRLLLAGIPAEKIVTVPRESEVPAALDLANCDGVFLLYDVYRCRTAEAVRDEILKKLEAQA